ncbi:MAG: hypothetical protein WAK53_16405 [Chromatiaceae bacterium]|jgi:hypothetical protein
MKRLFAMIAALVPLFVAAPLSAHHAADGLVADDVYDMIEANLEGTPHLDLDLTSIGSMNIVTVTVMADDLDLVLDAINAGLTGQGVQVSSSVEIDISLPDQDGWVTITVIEEMGQGESQVAP